MRSFGWILGFAALCGYVAGCNSQPAGTPYAESEAGAKDDEHAEHGHEHEIGPHGGHIVELTTDETIHGEFLLDAAGKMARFYILGADLKAPVEATAVMFHAEWADGEKEVAFTPATGDKAAEFTAPLADLPSGDIEALAGHFHVTVNGTELAGDLAHDHDHAGHDHADHDAHEHGEHDAPGT